MNLPQLPADKAGHVIAGVAVFLMTGALAALIGLHAAPLIGLMAAAAVGAAKELADYLLNRRAIAAGHAPPHGVDVLDFAATAAGGLACYLATLLP